MNPLGNRTGTLQALYKFRHLNYHLDSNHGGGGGKQNCGDKYTTITCHATHLFRIAPSIQRQAAHATWKAAVPGKPIHYVRHAKLGTCFPGLHCTTVAI